MLYILCYSHYHNLVCVGVDVYLHVSARRLLLESLIRVAFLWVIFFSILLFPMMNRLKASFVRLCITRILVGFACMCTTLYLVYEEVNVKQLVWKMSSLTGFVSRTFWIKGRDATIPIMEGDSTVVNKNKNKNNKYITVTQ